jgi:hypothetical protein
MALAEGLERRTKRAGRRNGVVSAIGIQVLRAMLFQFMNGATGMLCPSYAALQKHTGLCRASIANAIARLELTGIVRIVRRLVRQQITRRSPVTGEPETIVGTTQATSLYQVQPPPSYADHLAVPPARPAPFPCPRQLSLLQRMELLWSTNLSIARREKPLSAARQIANLMRMPTGR